MSKLNYKAVLSSGDVLERASNRPYSHAWAVRKNCEIWDKGFSGTKELAEKAAQASINFSVACQLKKNRDSYRLLFSSEVVQAKTI